VTIATNAISTLINQGHSLRTCPQALTEFRVVATRPVAAANGLGLTSATAAQNTTRFISIFPLLDDTPAIFPYWRNLVESQGIVGKPNHDARLFSVAATTGCSGILTFNTRDFHRYSVAVPAIAVLDPNQL
jgi:hypothetical protein